MKIRKLGRHWKVIVSQREYAQLEEDNFGMCLACGEESHSCEPDAENYTCDVCGEKSVHGLLNLLLLGHVIVH